jgi:CHASE2 domain-containing sensor protein
MLNWLFAAGSLEARLRRPERLKYLIVSAFAAAGAIGLGYLLAAALVELVFHHLRGSLH